MLKKIGILVVFLIGLFAVTGVVLAVLVTNETESTGVVTEATSPATQVESTAQAPVSVGNKVCPVTGLKIEKLGENTVEYQGKVYNLCCPDCKDGFLKNPDKYIAKVNEELAEEKTET